MENSKESNDGANKENPVEESPDAGDASASSNSPVPGFVPAPPRRPFTSLSQVDSDLALARTLQEQEHAYMMLRMAGDQGEYENSLSGSYVSEEDVDHLHENGYAESYEVDDGHGVEETNAENRGVGNEEDIEDVYYEEEEEDAVDDDVFDMHASEEIEQIDPSAFESDEAYARALQDAEERQLAAQMLAFGGINEWESEDGGEDNGSNSQDAWQEVDPDELSYEELLALGEAVGTESRGLTSDVIASLPSSIYKTTDTCNGTSEQCVICRLDYEEGDRVIVLSCKHTYHSDCINNWLQINKNTNNRKWVKKVQQEWSILQKNLPETIYVRVYEDRMDLLRAVIVGAYGTPYQDGLFFFDFYLPSEYPQVPPLAYYHSGGLGVNPNLYVDGVVCLSLLNTWTGKANERWNESSSSLLQVLLSLQGLVLNAKPYFNEAGYDIHVRTAEGEKNSLLYNENCFLLNCKSMMNILRSPPKGFEELVKQHFQKRGPYILKACDAYLNGAMIGSLTTESTITKDATEMESSSTGLKLVLVKILPKLVSALKEVGAECHQFEHLACF